MKTNFFKDCQTLDQAKKLYRELAQKFHPDKKPDGSKEIFQAINAAFHAFKPTAQSNPNWDMDKEQTAWNAKEYADIINQLIIIPGIEIEICGTWIWINGDTKPAKDRIKAVETGESYNKANFSANKGAWYFSPSGYRKRAKTSLGMEEIRAYYGSEKVEPEKRPILK